MAKALFRFLRGELNGYYLTKINNLLNVTSEDIKRFLYKFDKMQFNIATMDEETVYNLGKFAGVFLPRLASEEGFGSFRMSESKILNNQQVSERGLFQRGEENFTFQYALDESVDINTHATEDKKSSFVGKDDELIGYIDRTTGVLDEMGNIIETRVIPVAQGAPQNKAYSDYYGKKFLFIASPIKITQNINIELFYPLFKVLQYIRYNGANIVSFCKVVEILCPEEFVRIVSIKKHETLPVMEVRYIYNAESELDFKTQRIATLLYVIALKFPQFLMIETV